MPRQARLDVPGLVHHVMARGIEGREIFRDAEDREVFLARMAGIIDAVGGPRLYAWALMSNHFHLLLRSGEIPLASIMRRLMTGHAVRYNLRHERRGHLFQNRYKSIVVEEEAYFLELVRYIHLNPVRAGLVDGVEDLEKHPYSGHSVLTGKRGYTVQDVEAVLSRFSKRRQAAIQCYRDFMAAGFSQGAREELRGGGLLRSGGKGKGLLRQDSGEGVAADHRILGSGDFVERVLSECKTIVVGTKPDIDRILLEVATHTGIGREQILGPCRSRHVSSARREFFLRAHEEVGAAASTLGQVTGRSHVAVSLAIEKARSERAGKSGNG